MTERRIAFWAGQGVLLLAVGIFVWQSVAANWDAFRSLDIELRLSPGWVVASAATVLVTYVFLIEAWRRIVIGWGEQLPLRAAVGIWTISNLGRYLPGKVWSVAGLTVLSQRAGVAGWTAAGSAGATQAVALGTGVAVVSATAPGAASPVALGIGAAIAAGVVALLIWPPSVALLGRVLRRPLQPLPAGAVIVATLVTATAWVAYGVAFWLLARGVLGPVDLPLATAIGVFSTGYITGLLALVVPGGVGVREAVLVSLLAPGLGAGGAVAVGVASRLLLTVTEVIAAAVGALLRRVGKESPGAES